MGSDWRDFLVPTAEPLRAPRFRRNIFLYGPNELGLRENLVYGGSPEEFVRNNPQLFATGTTSRDEGYAYWGFLHVIGPEAQPGKNGMVWFYQSKVAGGSNRPGGSIIDFLVEAPGRGRDLGIRIVTPYRHTLAGPLKRATDEEQKYALLRQGILAVDIFSKNYISDQTGLSVILAVQRAIEAQHDFSPLNKFVGH